jgi:hypothetical protein
MRTSPHPGSATVVAVALLAAFMVFVLSCSPVASALPVPAAGTPEPPWAYGGVAWSNGTVLLGNTTTTVSWAGMFGWTVIFTVTQTAPGIWMIEEQRTVGITISASFTGALRSGSYHYIAHATDVAFANVTNQSTVYVNDLSVPALGILNASFSESASTSQSISATMGYLTRSASLDVTGNAAGSVSFSPSLGLIPLNLTGVTEWNSSATATAAAHWNLAWTWNDRAFNGTTGSGAGSKVGSLSGVALVNLAGFKVVIAHPFNDHKARVGVLLVLQGPFDCYDGFILIPHDFDLFGAAAHGYDSLALGSAGISTESLALSSGPGGLAVTAADQTFGSADTAVNAQVSPMTGASPAASSSSPEATVQGQPMSVAQAQSLSQQLTGGAASSAAKGVSVVLLGIAVAVVAVIVTVLVAERRRVPPPVYPNANLYPPGPGAGAPYQPAVRPGESLPPPEEEDPLDHLW